MREIIPIAHRGFWTSEAEQNQLPAFRRAFERGYGVETDLRDEGCRLVISHDVPHPGCTPADALFEAYREARCRAPLALNVKADGLQSLIADALQRSGLPPAFVFDMSVPEMVRYVQRAFRVFTRHSEHEPQPSLYDLSQGVWVDQFLGDWVTADVLRRHLDRGKSVCVVSPELHRRDPTSFWSTLRQAQRSLGPGEAQLMLCTDAPDRAEVFFKS